MLRVPCQGASKRFARHAKTQRRFIVFEGLCVTRVCGAPQLWLLSDVVDVVMPTTGTSTLVMSPSSTTSCAWASGTSSPALGRDFTSPLTPARPRHLRPCARYKFRLMADESLSWGVLGDNGRGVTEHYNLPVSAIDVIIASLSGSLGSIGGFCVGK